MPHASPPAASEPTSTPQSPPVHPLVALPRRFWQYALRINEAFDRNHGGLMAAAVSFYTMLSLVPLLSAGVAVLGMVMGSPEKALERIRKTISDYLPPGGSAELYVILKDIEAGRGLLGLLGLIGILFVGSATFANMEIAFNRIWNAPKPRSLVSQRLVAMGSALLTLLLLFCSIGLTSLLTYVQHVRVPGLGFTAGQIPFLWQFLGYLVPFLLSVLMFSLIYRITPNASVTLREALLGGLFAGTAWEAAKHLFAFYVAHFANYSKVYGSLGGLVMVVIWIYYSATILFLGAVIAADYGERRRRSPVPKGR